MKFLIAFMLIVTMATSAMAFCDMPDTWECIESDNVDGFVLTWFPKLMPVFFWGIIAHTKSNDRGTWVEDIMFYGFPYQVVIMPDLTTYEEYDND